jgi:hypothetical protein
MIPEPETRYTAAARRLEQAILSLEASLARGGPGGDLFEKDRADLAAKLDAARAREKALEGLAAEASEALGRAAAEVRAALKAGG